MSLIDPIRIINNLIVLFILLGIAFIIYSKIDKDKRDAAIESLKRLFGSKEE